MSFRILLDKLERDSISSYLPVMAYDETRSLYYSTLDYSAGFLLEVAPLQFSSPQLNEALTAFLTARWPKNSLVQFCLYSDPNLDPVLIPFRKLRGHHTDIEIVSDPARRFMYEWAMNYADYLETKKFHGIDKIEVPVPFRNFRAFISAKMPCSQQNFNSMSNDIQLLLANRELLIGGLKTCHVPAWAMHPDSYMKLMYQLFNIGHPLPALFEDDPHNIFGTGFKPYVKWNPSQPISMQIVEKDTFIRRSLKTCRIDNWSIQAKTLADLPPEVYPTDINLLIGDIGQANLKQITCPFLLSLTLDCNSQNHLVTGKGNLVLEQRAALPGLKPRLEKRQNEMMQANAYIDSGGKLLQGMMSMVLFGKNKVQVTKDSSVAQSIWLQRNYKLQNEAGLNLPLFLASQPLGVTYELFNKLKRAHVGPAESFAMLAPLQADTRTNSKPTFIFLSRRGQIVGHDLRDSPRDYNGVIFAPTGSGKSFATNYFITTNASVGGRQFIVDVGRSYEKLCRTMNGQYIEFKMDSNISLNIFSLIEPEKWLSEESGHLEEIEMYRGMGESMLHQMASPNSPIQDTERSLLDNFMAEIYDELAEVWRKKPVVSQDVEQEILDLLQNLKALSENPDTAGRDLAEDAVEGLLRELGNFSFALKTSRVSTAELSSRISRELQPLIKGFRVGLSRGTLAFEENQHIAPHRIWALIDSIEDAIHTLNQGADFNMIDAMISRLLELQGVYDSKGRVDNVPGHLAERLRAFSSKGRHGQWFKGKFNLEFDNKLVVLELEELAKSEELKQVVMMLVLASIEHKIYITPDRATPTLVIMDEVWDLLVGANTAEFIEKAYRRMRKYGASMLTITQSIFDMLDKNKSVGQAVLNNSSWKFFLGPSQTEVERASKENLLSLSEMQKQLMVSTHTQKGLYSELCYFDPYGVMRIGRLHVDRKTMLLYSTHPLEVDALNAIRDRFSLPPWQSIQALEPYWKELHAGVPLQVILGKIEATDWESTTAEARSA